MRFDEEFAMRRFETYLSREIDAAKIKWVDGDDPPDFNLFVDTAEFAVEVTTLMEMVDLGSKVIERRGIDGSWSNLVNEVEREAKSEGILNGIYIVTFGLPTNELRSQRHDIKTFLLDYIKRTQPVTSSAREDFKADWMRLCSIEKHVMPGSCVEFAGPLPLRWDGDAEQDMCRLLHKALTEKSFDLGLPMILLLLDENHFIDPRHYRECHIDPTLLEKFHFVFVVNPYDEPDQDFVLYSSGADWGPV